MSQYKKAHDEASKMKGWLKKKSPSIFKGYQKRWFYILEKMFFVYSEKEGSEVKGSIDLSQAIINECKDSKCFIVKFSDREFELKAESEQERNNWVQNLKTIVSIFENKRNLQNEPQQREIAQSWKIKNLEADALKAVQKAGVFQDKDFEDSKKCFEVKGLGNIFKNIDVKLKESRIIYGFLEKRHKTATHIYQKRWLFLISSRPLTDEVYQNDENELESRILPSFISFDELYYYEFENDADNSESKGRISLNECHGLQIYDENEKFYLTIDLGDRKFEFLSTMKGERDKWFEALRCSRKTAREIKISFTKNPRNVSKLSKILDTEGFEKLKLHCEKEKARYIKGFEEINSIEELELIFHKIGDFLLKTADGCLVSKPQKMEILKIYVEVFNEELIQIAEKFWNRNKDQMSASEFIDMGMVFSNYQNKIYKIGIKDNNFDNNASELFKIWARKTFSLLKELQDEIMKKEREIKFVENEGIYMTYSPTDIFKILNEIFEQIRSKNNKKLVENFQIIIYELVLRYLLGMEFLISKKNYIFENEFLIAISNNKINFLNNLQSLIDQTKQKEFNFEDKEIEQRIKVSQIFQIFNHISKKSLGKVVEENFTPIIQLYNRKFLDINMNDIVKKTFETFEPLVFKMHEDIHKAFWKETLDVNMFIYINKSLFKNKSKVHFTSQITDKLKKDKELLISAYRDQIGTNTCNESLSIIECILDFLETSLDMISISCANQRKLYGEAFTIHTAKALLNLRVELTSSERKEAIEICTKYIQNADKGSRGDRGTTVNLRILGMIDQTSENDADAESAKEENEEEDESEATKVMDFASFFQASEAEENIDIEEIINEEPPEEEFIYKKQEKITEDKDDVLAGYLQKKKNANWQERYFQLKNGYLYWYKDDKSREAQNFIPVKKIQKVEEYKELCFAMTLDDQQMYKFKAESSQMKEKWMEQIKIEIRKLKVEKKFEIVYETKERKRFISNIHGLHSLGRNHREIIEVISTKLENETYFQKRKKFVNKLTLSTIQVPVEIQENGIRRETTMTVANSEDKTSSNGSEGKKSDSFCDSFSKIFSCCLPKKKEKQRETLIMK